MQGWLHLIPEVVRNVSNALAVIIDPCSIALGNDFSLPCSLLKSLDRFVYPRTQDGALFMVIYSREFKSSVVKFLSFSGGRILHIGSERTFGFQ